MCGGGIKAVAALSAALSVTDGIIEVSGVSKQCQRCVRDMCGETHMCGEAHVEAHMCGETHMCGEATHMCLPTQVFFKLGC